jgi:hypothetical protein
LDTGTKVEHLYAPGLPGIVIATGMPGKINVRWYDGRTFHHSPRFIREFVDNAQTTESE